jgi:hypothetical protein
MKKLNLFALSLISILLFQACEGPPGPPGLPGIDAVNIVSRTFEERINFTAANNYSDRLRFTQPIEEGDVVLVFVKWEEDDGARSIWRALPQTVFFDDRIVLIYNYDFTNIDFTLFLEGTVDFTTLGPEWITDQLFRVIVVPGDFASSRIDFTNYEAVTAMLGLKDEDFKRPEIRTKK